MNVVASNMTPERLDEAIVAALATSTYTEVAEALEVSRGRVYSAACRFGARKHEMRIQAKAAERKAIQREFAQSVLNATAKADVLDYLDGMPDGCAQMVLTSPPYNISRRYADGPGADNLRFSFYLGWMIQVCSEMARVLDNGGILFLQIGATKGPDQQLYPLDCLLFQHLCGMGLQFQSRVIWTIPHGLTPKQRLSERAETALVFSKGVPRTFNPTPARSPQAQPSKRSYKGPRKGELSGNPFGAHPSNVWDDIGNAGHNRRDGVVGHPAQMPAALARRAILLYSLPDDLVLDPFSGSGTTHAECVRTGRAFSGADLNYGDLRAERLAKVVPDLVSVLPGISDKAAEIWDAEATPVHVPASAPEQLCLTA